MVYSFMIFYSYDGILELADITAICLHSPSKPAFHSLIFPSSPEDDSIVPVTFHSTRHTYNIHVNKIVMSL